MINIKYDANRKHEDGNYFIELVSFDPTDSSHVDRLGYWCDLGHFRVGIIKPILSKFSKEVLIEVLRELINS